MSLSGEGLDGIGMDRIACAEGGGGGVEQLFD